MATGFGLSLAGHSEAEPSPPLTADDLGMVRSSATSGTFRLAPEVQLHFGPRTEARVFARPQELGLFSGAPVKTWTVVVVSGRVDVEVKKQQRRAVLIHDSDRRGGICLGGRLVLGTRENRTAVANVEGSSVAIAKGRISELDAGSQVVFGTTDETPQRLTLARAAAPELTSSLWAAPGGLAKITGIRATPSAGAVEYELNVRAEGEKEPSMRVATRDPSAGFQLDLPPGRHLASLRTIDALGIPTAASAEIALRVVGVSLPDGAAVDQLGRIHLADSQKIEFTHAEGLLLTHTGGKQSVHASSPVGLFNNELTAVALRQPGSLDLAVALLMPQKLTAEVQAGPKFATWPEDPVEIVIQLRGDLRRESLRSLVATVTLGLEPIAVTWREQGAQLIGTVQPQVLKDPAVLRVEVTDQRGVRLGRDFVELIASPHRRSTALGVAAR